MKTYSCKEVIITLGTHTVTGYAEDSFVSIDEKGEGVTSTTGCDGEVIRQVDPNEQSTIKISVQQYSPTNSFLMSQYNQDRATGDGCFPILIKDLKGTHLFSAEDCWVTKKPTRGYGKAASNREWTLETGKSTDTL